MFDWLLTQQWFRRLYYRWQWIKHSGECLNQRATVEGMLFDVAAGKVPLPSREDCRQLALYLGIRGYKKPRIAGVLAAPAPKMIDGKPWNCAKCGKPIVADLVWGETAGAFHATCRWGPPLAHGVTAAPAPEFSPHAVERAVFDEMTRIEPNWNAYGRSRESAVRFALRAVANLQRNAGVGEVQK